MSRWLSLIGIGEDGAEALSPLARSLIAKAEMLVGGTRQLALIPDDGQARPEWGGDVHGMIEEIAARRGQAIVVLATGDPMWFGIGATLRRRFAAEEMLILPSPSAFSLVAARLGWPLAETECLSVHGRAMARIQAFFAPDARLIALAGNGDTPSAVAELLVEAGYGASEMTAFAHMGGPKEECFHARADDWGKTRVPDFNTLAVACRAGPEARILSRAPGLPDDAFRHDGQLTKREVRAATLAALTPLPRQLLWDVGAGCGSVAIEWLRAERMARAIAVERSVDRIALIEENALALGVPDLAIHQGDAPGVLADLEDPDAVFLGGGLTVPGLLERTWERLKPGGRLVANAVTFEGEQKLQAQASELRAELVRLEISRAADVGRFKGWNPLKPVTQLRAVKR
jgi:precorrin-6Y C5,15-methyltransferase (decarboxylating)